MLSFEISFIPKRPTTPFRISRTLVNSSHGGPNFRTSLTVVCQKKVSPFPPYFFNWKFLSKYHRRPSWSKDSVNVAFSKIGDQFFAKKSGRWQPKFRPNSEVFGQDTFRFAKKTGSGHSSIIFFSFQAAHPKP